MPLKPETLLNNRYKILLELGQGGMGSLYRAFDESLEIFVAVKENLYLSNEFARQFQQEAKILAGLKHPSLPRVLDYFQIPGQGQYLVMDFIEGDDLRQRIDLQGVISEVELIRIGAAVCDALTYLHSRSPIVVHRDIKPGNIKITPEGEIALIDFGLAKVVEDNQATITGARAMTPGYSPPEQYGTAHTDERSDIYSLGATLYAAITGIIPEDALSRATGKLSLTPVRQLNPDVNRQLAAAIEKALEIAPENRYQTAGEFKRDMLASVDPSEIPLQSDFLRQPGTITRSDAGVKEVEPPSANLKGKRNDLTPEKRHVSDIQKLSPSARKRISFTGLLAAMVILIAGFFVVNAWFPQFLSFRSISLEETTPSQSTDQISIPSSVPVNTATNTVEPPKPTAEIIPPSPTTHSTAVLASVPLPTFTPSPTQTGGGTGQISFVSDRTGTNQVWIMNADGSSQKQLTSISEGACQPDWSPDGKKLAVISPCEMQQITYKNAKIYILDSNGENPVEMPGTLPGDFDPAWSPDGQRLAFTSYRSGVSHIFVYDFNSGALQELSDSRFSDMHPSWHPVGKQLAFTRLITFFHIFVMSDKGQTQFQFSSMGNLNDYWPKWSADGDFIIFGRTSTETSIPYIARLRYEDRSKGTETKIPPVEKRISPPHVNADLSPDMLWLAYESWPDGRNHDIYLVGVDGEGWLRLTTDPGYDFDPDWLPVIESE